MLGSLARWLRILGYDTLYYSDRDDEELRAEAEKTDRTLVTRDAELYHRAVKNGSKAVLIQSEHTLEQLNEITNTLGLKTTPVNTRCPKCNGLLNEVEKSSVKDLVPSESFNAFEEFWLCGECGSVYWRGSHWTQIVKSLDGLTPSLYK